MKRHRSHALVLFLAWIVPSVACNIPGQDPTAIQTVAALTVRAALTEGAAASTATFTPVPSLAPATAVIATGTVPAAVAPTASCDKASFVGETVADNTVLAAGNDFSKTWTVKNIGTCSWTPSYSLVFVSGDAMAGPANVSLGSNINPGQNITLSVNLEAPDSNGTYRGNWGLRNAAGVIFSNFWVQIKVGGGGGGEFAVTHVTYSFSESDYAGHDDCPMVTAHITANGPGEVEYRWTRSDGASAPVNSITFAAAGTKNVTTNWALGATWEGTAHWLGIYVEEPNHQEFGHQSFTDACDG